jgi:hypothetical protein
LIASLSQLSREQNQRQQCEREKEKEGDTFSGPARMILRTLIYRRRSTFECGDFSKFPAPSVAAAARPNLDLSE